MPHLIIEHSANIRGINVNTLLPALHQAVSTVARLQACKSRLYVCEHFCVGEGHAFEGFFALTVKLLPGRDDETKRVLAEKLEGVLLEHVTPHIKTSGIEAIPTIEILDLGPYHWAGGRPGG